MALPDGLYDLLLTEGLARSLAALDPIGADKKILFENPDGLFQQLRAADPAVRLIREAVALSMTADEIHEDVHEFIAKVRAMTGTA